MKLTASVKKKLLSSTSLSVLDKKVIESAPIDSDLSSLPTIVQNSVHRFVASNPDWFGDLDHGTSGGSSYSRGGSTGSNPGMRLPIDDDQPVNIEVNPRDPFNPIIPDRDNPREHQEDVYRGDEDGDGIVNGSDSDFQSNDGLFGGLFSGLSGLGLGSLVQSIIGKYTDATVTGGEVIRNQWDLDKMSISNQFSAQQAEISRDWQEEMYAKYNSLSGKISQAREAGVNPLFAVTGNAVSPMSTTSGAPSGTAVTGSGQKSVSDLLSSLASLIGLKAQIKKTNAETQQIETNTDISLQKLGAELSNLESSTQLNMQKVVESATSIEKIKSDINLNDHHAELFAEQVQYLISLANYINAIKEPERRLKVAQATIAEWQERNKELFKGIEIGADVVGTLSDIGIGIFNAKTKRIFANSN